MSLGSKAIGAAPGEARGTWKQEDQDKQQEEEQKEQGSRETKRSREVGESEE